MRIALLLQILWGTLILAWLLGALKQKPVARRLAGWPRILQIALVTIGIPLFASRFGPGWLNASFVPDTAVLAWLGVAMTAAGIAIALWARFVLGQNWSSQVAVKQGHELILRGPYRLVRHPIYSGVLLALFGTAITMGQVRALIGFGMFLVGWWFKARAEETLMLEQFGEQYSRYRSEVKGLIPFIL